MRLTIAHDLGHCCVCRRLLVSVAWSGALLLGGIWLYPFFATAMGIFVGALSGSIVQIALLVLITVLPMQGLSGAMTPIECQPEWFNPITMFFPYQHFVSFSQSSICRRPAINDVWQVEPGVASVAFARRRYCV
ncbi:ABC transporter permease [Aporhodopirellula aestuarii]|uniref:ABC transporter permease n=1 Tax=Aporhodopirellula aestuarii TaxID=2950107 RepID=A0ABT0TY24_9BACT|nr:ABC transporter permease [Aporhodopirellula aestuarii]MCM2369494.1 ABC transporter permease [Aporhodopirellula aestuarii]